MQNPNNPSLFTCTNTRESDGFVEEFTVDLSKVCLMAKRTLETGSGYYLHTSSGCLCVSAGIGDQVHAAWIAFQGKFIPGQTN